MSYSFDGVRRHFKTDKNKSLRITLVENNGIEPLTYGLQSHRSPSWANPPSCGCYREALAAVLSVFQDRIARIETEKLLTELVLDI